MLIPSNVKIEMRAGGSYAIGTAVDFYLEPAEIETLYKKWSPNWPEIYTLHGNEKMITCEQVVEVGLKPLVDVYGKKLGSKLFTVAQKNAVL